MAGDHALTEDQVVTKQKSSMRTRSLILFFLFMPLSGCIVWYVGHPEVTVTTQSFATNETSLPFYLQIPRAPWYQNDPPDNYKTFLNAMAQVGLTPETGAPDTLPETGRYCLVELSVKVVAQPGADILVLFIPTGGTSLYTLDYVIYENKERLKGYRYDFRQEEVIWGPLLAFVWVNWLNSTKQDAFAATLRQFIQDAQGDGYL